MNHASQIIERLKYHLCIDDDDHLAEFLGITPATIAMWKTRNRVNWLVIETRCTEVDMGWLRTGKGFSRSEIN